MNKENPEEIYKACSDKYGISEGVDEEFIRALHNIARFGITDPEVIPELMYWFSKLYDHAPNKLLNAFDKKAAELDTAGATNEDNKRF